MRLLSGKRNCRRSWFSAGLTGSRFFRGKSSAWFADQLDPSCLEDYKSDGYYVLSSTGEIKRLNHELIVQDMRYTGITGRFVWARDRLTDDIQMAFLPLRRFPYGARYSYETDQIEPLGWRYEFLDIGNE